MALAKNLIISVLVIASAFILVQVGSKVYRSSQNVRMEKQLRVSIYGMTSFISMALNDPQRCRNAIRHRSGNPLNKNIVLSPFFSQVPVDKIFLGEAVLLQESQAFLRGVGLKIEVTSIIMKHVEKEEIMIEQGLETAMNLENYTSQLEIGFKMMSDGKQHDFFRYIPLRMTFSKDANRILKCQTYLDSYSVCLQFLGLGTCDTDRMTEEVIRESQCLEPQCGENPGFCEREIMVYHDRPFERPKCICEINCEGSRAHKAVRKASRSERNKNRRKRE